MTNMWNLSQREKNLIEPHHNTRLNKKPSPLIGKFFFIIENQSLIYSYQKKDSSPLLVI